MRLEAEADFAEMEEKPIIDTNGEVRGEDVAVKRFHWSLMSPFARCAHAALRRGPWRQASSLPREARYATRRARFKVGIARKRRAASNSPRR